MPQSPHPTREAAESPSLVHQPFLSLPLPIGNHGIDLITPVDGLPSGGLSRLTNGIATPSSGIETRPGLTAETANTASTAIHSILRVNAPTSTPALNYYFWGVGTTLRWNVTGGSPATIDTGYSGDPLTWAAWTNEFTHKSAVYVGDRTKMRKVLTTTGEDKPIGLPAPAAPATIVPSTPLTTTIAAFTPADGTDATRWRKGYTTGEAPYPGVPTVTAVDGPAVGSSGLLIQTDPGAVSGSYTSYIFCPLVAPDGSYTTRNLDLVGTGGDQRPATDDDVIHLWMKFNRPDHIQEVRVYFQCSPLTRVPADSGIIPDKHPPPGMVPAANEATLITAGVVGGAAYVRAFRPSDYTDFVAGTETALQAASAIRTNDLLRGYTEPPATITGDNPTTPSEVVHPPGESTWSASGGVVGTTAWTEYGKIGVPLRRSDFIKVGSAGQTTPVVTDWSTIHAIWILITASDNFAVDCALDDCYLTGGWDPDTSEPDATPYDYRLTNYDLTTGARSNPSPVMTAAADQHDVLRQKVTITPAAAYGDANVRQEAWRRGGANGGDWFFVSANAADGGAIIDTASDVLAAASGALEIDHDQPVTTVSATGTAIYAQAVPSIFGPIEGYLFACGDPSRAGSLYWSKRNEPDHWPAANHLETCAPNEELQNGDVYGGQGFVFSRERLYSIQVDISGGSVLTLPTECDRGIMSRTAFAVGLGGIYGVSRHEVFATTGGAPRVLSKVIEPLFNGETVNGYYPIDFAVPTAIRLSVYSDDLWFMFQDTNGSRVFWVYSFAYDRWRFAKFGVPVYIAYPEPGDNTKRQLIFGGSGTSYSHRGVTDAGTGIPVLFRTNAESFGHPREEKLLGDVAARANLYGVTLSIQAFLNADVSSNTALTVAGTSVLDRYVFDLFGTTPQHADSLSLECSWTTNSGCADLPLVDRLYADTAIQPEVTMNRATTWQPLHERGEAYVIGMYVDCDTGGSARTILVEGLLNGAAVAIATLTVNSNHGRRLWFSWTAVHVDMIRLRPTGACEPWMLFGQGWICTPEPPRISKWDSVHENQWDQYITGLDIECDTFSANKTVEVFVDSVLVKTETINTASRLVKHITIPWLRGHILRFRATDSNVGLLYTHRWHTDEEPTEQHNFLQNYTVAGTLSDKWCKGILLETDTFGVNKEIKVEVDHVVVFTGTINTNNRRSVHIAFPQVLGRVFRLYPTDTVPARLYSHVWLFDEEPISVVRFESQEQPDGIRDYHIPIDGQIAIKSNSPVTLTILSYGQNGVALGTKVYTLPSTGGVKSMLSAHTFLEPQKGLLFRQIYAASTPFWLYTEESWLTMQPLSGGQPTRVFVLGNDALDPAREMRNAVITAKRAGGASASG